MNNALRTEFKRKCKERISDKDLLGSLESLFEEDGVKGLPDAHLWQALNFPMRWVQVNALYEIFRRRAGSLEGLPAGGKILLVGALAWPLEVIGPILSKVGYEVIVWKNEQAVSFEAVSANERTGKEEATWEWSQIDAVVLGPAPGEEFDQGIPEDIVLLKEEDLAELAVRNGNFYLLQPDQAVAAGNLRSMLLSKDRNSIQLGLQLMEQGGMPPELITVLFSLKRSRLPWALRQVAGGFLLRFTKGRFRQNLLRNYFELLGSDRSLLSADLSEEDPEGYLDIDQYLRLNFHLSPGNLTNAENLVMFHNGLVGVSEPTLQAILTSMESEKRLRFPKTTEEFPAVTYRMEHLKSIEVYHAPITKVPEGISGMPSLIRIWFNCPLESLPADLGQSNSIRMVNLFNGQLPEFPEQIAEIKRLKIIRWEDCLADSEQTLILPDILFKRALNTAIIIEKKVQFPDSFYECHTLKSLALSYDCAITGMGELHAHKGLQRLRIQFEPETNTDPRALLDSLPGWRMEDRNERNFSFIRK